MNHLLRSAAPISDAGWELLDGEARDRLTPALAARRLFDVTGPLGWTHSASNLGRVGEPKSVAGVSARQRLVLPLVELRADFSLGRDELRAADRGAGDVDLGALDEAVQRIARGENSAVLHGLKNLVLGLGEAASLEPLALPGGAAEYPETVARAVGLLLEGGIAGPYALALGPETYTAVVAASERGGYPLVDHLRQITAGPVVWAPGLEGATVVSQRGGDFVFELGQDVSIGYQSHDDGAVQLYLEESFSFRVNTPEAAVVLVPPRAGRKRRG